MAYELGKPYLLFSNCGAGQCLSVSGDESGNIRTVCIQDQEAEADHQKWIVKASGSGCELVPAQGQDYALSYSQAERHNDQKDCDVSLQAENKADCCIVLEPVDADAYRIKLKDSNLYLTASGSETKGEVRWEAPAGINADFASASSQEWRFVEYSATGFRAPLIYAGFTYDKNAQTVPIPYSYTPSQLDGLGNATEFVICSGVFGYFFESTGKPNSNGTIQKYVVAAVDMVSKLRSKYPGKQVWIGTPLVGANVAYTNTTAYAEVGRRMTYFVDNIIAEFKLNNLSFDSCVKGFYMSNEGVMNPFNANIAVADNCEVSMFQTLANYVSAKGKKMLWIPSWDTDNSIIKMACVAQRTNIFDYMLIQPGHFFSRNEKDKCFAIRKSIQTQTVCSEKTGYPPILSSGQITCHKTVIGCQMEIGKQYSDTNTFGQAYRECVDIFSQTVGAYSKNSTNFGFYFECPTSDPDSAYNVLKQKVNEFFA